MQRVRVQHREPLGDGEPAARAAAAVPTDAGHSVQVLRHDDERVPFPVTTRVTHIRRHVRRELGTAIERDHARLVNHLVADDRVARPLRENLVPVVVDRGSSNPMMPRVMQRS